MWSGRIFLPVKVYSLSSVTTSENIAARNVFLLEFGFVQLHLLGGT
jgi:hypothetical protein